MMHMTIEKKLRQKSYSHNVWRAIRNKVKRMWMKDEKEIFKKEIQRKGIESLHQNG